MSAGLLLLGGLSAGQASGQSRSPSTQPRSSSPANDQENGETTDQTTLVDGEAEATSGRRLSTQGESPNFSNLGITPETYIQRIMSVESGQTDTPQARQA
ncbi:MAG: hypothetical protein ICV77_10170 [Cyanobacteria bacterium Co-bin8]|nr:hypothetical protein [Cyanobacteria bacterium Co-bin8]